MTGDYPEQPSIGVGVAIVENGHVLLVQRGKDPGAVGRSSLRESDVVVRRPPCAAHDGRVGTRIEGHEDRGFERVGRREAGRGELRSIRRRAPRIQRSSPGAAPCSLTRGCARRPSPA